MRFFKPYVLLLLFVFTTENNFSQNDEGYNEVEIDSLISNGKFDKAESLIRQLIKSKEEVSNTNFGDEL